MNIHVPERRRDNPRTRDAALPRLLLLTVAMIAASIGPFTAAQAAPTYTINKVFVAQDEYKGEKGLEPRALFKPHDSRTSADPEFWITSNERTGCAGISIFHNGSNRLIAKLFIDDPAVAYPADESSAAPPCVGTVDTTPPPPEPPEGTPPPPEAQFPDAQRFSPSLCLPIVLPPGQAFVPVSGVPGVTQVASPAAGLVCAPLGAEKHARHPHGLSIDHKRGIAYQVIEHSGLRWNSDRTAFQVAFSTDEESGMTLAYDIRNPEKPKILRAYLSGHGAHELVVNQRSGLVFQGNHEDSPGVYPPIWVDVINPAKTNPYGFIDTGYFNAIQGLDAGTRVRHREDYDDTGANIVYGATHVGEKIFAFDGNCDPKPTPAATAAPPAPAGYALPVGDNGMKMGWNCVLWWVDIRPAFLAANPELTTILSTATAPSIKPNVLHLHNLASDPAGRKAYATIHSIHDAEHTGLDAASGATEEVDEGSNFMGRWVVEAGMPVFVNPMTKKATAPLSIIDLSNGYDVLPFPHADDVIASVGLNGLMKSFVHAHFLWVDARHDTLLVTGEHTGNLGVFDLRSRRLTQVIPISRKILGCVPPPPEPGEVATPEEPHVHGVTVHPRTGAVYVSDEGEHCFYESVTILKP